MTRSTFARAVALAIVVLPSAATFGAPVLAAQSPADVGARLDSALRALEANGFSGVVRVDRGGTTLIEKGYGLANRATGARFTPRTVVQIGSNTKDFTIVSLLQLHERGRLSVYDSLGKFLPAAPADKRAITLWQLAQHTAGFPIGLGGDFEQLAREQFIAEAMKRPLLFTPGAGRQYSNTAYALLAAVIEQVSGVSYDEYVRANILAPAGLRRTGFLLPAFASSELAHGYRDGQDMGDLLSKPHAEDGPFWNLRGNGGMLSTVGDMREFYRVLFETNMLLKPETRRMQFDPDQPVGLAGSDLVNVFLYERLPGRGVELLIATNTAEFKERPVRAAIGAILGLPSPDGRPGPAAGPRKNPNPPSPAVAQLIRSFVAVLERRDVSELTTFLASHVLIEPGTPEAAARAQRYMTMRGNLGALSIVGMDEVSPGVVEVSLQTANEGPATLRFQVAADGKIRSMQVLVGG